MILIAINRSSGKFGLFGLKKDEVADPTLNTVGALLSLLRILILAFMDSKVAMSM